MRSDLARSIPARRATFGSLVAAFAARCAVFAVFALCIAGLAAPAAAKPVDECTNHVPYPLPHSEANELLTAHTNWFVPKLYDLGTFRRGDGTPYLPGDATYRVYSAVGFNLANSIFLVHEETGQIVVVDTLGDPETVEVVLRSLRCVLDLPAGADLPIETIIYTHNHIDHTAGVEGYLDAAQKPVCDAQTTREAGPDGFFRAQDHCVDVISQQGVTDAVVNTGTVIGYILNTRSAYMYGNICQAIAKAQFAASRQDAASGGGADAQTKTEAGMLGPVAGSDAPGFEGCIVNDGIGPWVHEGTSGYRLPSRTFTDTLYVDVAGLRLLLAYVPSETNDEVMVFLADDLNTASGGGDPANPDDWSGGRGLLLSAEVIQGPAFPNLYSLRGTKFRNPAQWFRSVDVLRQFDSWCMVPSHGPPLCGEEDVQTLLRNFRDAIQFTHDQTLRHMYQAQTPDELVEEVVLPEYLIDDLDSITTAAPDMDPKDYLRKFYGSVPQAVREIYNGYLGWYEADPVDLSPTPPTEAAERTVALMGGPAQVLDAARDALGECEAQYESDVSECQWAAELASLVLAAEPPQADAADARTVKATAFRRQAAVELDPNWRNWYLTAALELDGALDGIAAPTGGLVSPEIVGALPPGAWVNSWTLRLRAEVTAPENGDRVTESLGFRFTGALPDPVQRYVLKIRGAVAEFIEVDDVRFNAQEGLDAWSETDLQISLSQSELLALLKEQADSITAKTPETFGTVLGRAIDDGRVDVLRGDRDEVQSYFDDYFDPRPFVIQKLASR